MLHLVPMFFYNWYFHARRPDLDYVLEKEEESASSNPELATTIPCSSPIDTSRRGHGRDASSSNTDAGKNSWRSRRLTVDDDSSVSSIHSESSLRSVLKMPCEADNPSKILPMPIVPFVSIDLRSLETTDEDHLFSETEYLIHSMIMTLQQEQQQIDFVSDNSHVSPEEEEKDELEPFIPFISMNLTIPSYERRKYSNGKNHKVLHKEPETTRPSSVHPIDGNLNQRRDKSDKDLEDDDDLSTTMEQSQHPSVGIEDNSSDVDPTPTSTSTPYQLAAAPFRRLFLSHISFPTPLEDITNNDWEEEEILDPTDPLIYGKIDSFFHLNSISEKMNFFLLNFDNDTAQEALIWMTQHPMVCQVKYRADFDKHSYCLPLHFFCTRARLDCCQTAYQAYPEAIGIPSSHVGLPLHYACLYQANNDLLVAFLVEKFPDAVRITNQDHHQTPLHLACQSPQCSLRTIQILLEHFPTATQLVDGNGFTPLHYALQSQLSSEILTTLQSSGTVVIAVTTKT